MILLGRRRQWQVSRESSSQTECFLPAWEQGETGGREAPPLAVRNGTCCKSAVYQAGGSVCLVDGTGKDIPVAHRENPLQFHDAVYWTFAVASKGEAGMVKQSLSEAAPRRA